MGDAGQVVGSEWELHNLEYKQGFTVWKTVRCYHVAASSCITLRNKGSTEVKWLAQDHTSNYLLRKLLLELINFSLQILSTWH